MDNGPSVSERLNAVKGKVTNVRRTAIYGVDSSGKMKASYEVELDGYAPVTAVVTIPNTIGKIKDPVRRREKTISKVLTSALKDIESAIAAHS